MATLAPQKALERLSRCMPPSKPLPMRRGSCAERQRGCQTGVCTSALTGTTGKAHWVNEQNPGRENRPLEVGANTVLTMIQAALTQGGTTAAADERTTESRGGAHTDR